MRGRSISGLCRLIVLIPSSPGSKCSGVSDTLTIHRRAEPFVQQEIVRLSPGHTIDTESDDPKHTSINMIIIIMKVTVIRHCFNSLYTVAVTFLFAIVCSEVYGVY